MKEIETEQRVLMAPESASTGKRRGRPENVEEAKRRSAVLERVQAGGLTNAEAAAELGITYAAWSARKSIHGKRNGALVAAPKVRAAKEAERDDRVRAHQACGAAGGQRLGRQDREGRAVRAGAATARARASSVRRGERTTVISM